MEKMKEESAGGVEEIKVVDNEAGSEETGEG